MRRFGYTVCTILCMLIVSRFLIRILDATMLIDDLFILMLVLLVLVNGTIGYGGYRLYRKKL